MQSDRRRLSGILSCFNKQTQKQEYGLAGAGRQQLRDAAYPSKPHTYNWYVIENINDGRDRVDHDLPLEEAIPLDSLHSGAVKGMVAPLEEDAMTMDEIINAAVNQRVEAIIANDRSNLSVTELTGTMALHDLKDYQLYGAKEKAVDMFFSVNEPDGQFHGGFALKGPQETAFIAYITDPELFMQDEAETYIKIHGEKLLLNFLKNDACLRKIHSYTPSAQKVNGIFAGKRIPPAL